VVKVCLDPDELKRLPNDLRLENVARAPTKKRGNPLGEGNYELFVGFANRQLDGETSTQRGISEFAVR
jgi:hypothetical protein